MSPVVRIPDDVFLRLQKLAVPLVDSVGDVIARLLDEHEKQSPPESNSSEGAHEMALQAIAPPPAQNVDDGHRRNMAAHPDFSRAPSGTQQLHDRVRDLLIREFDAEVRVDQRTLVFRSAGKNFAAIQRLGLRDQILDLSIFGEPAAFDDPHKLITTGRFPHWSKIRIDRETDLEEICKIARQSHGIRMRRASRSA
jgi:hypothetical protein